MTTSVIVFGNCQAEAVASALRFAPALQNAGLIYIPSFNITEAELATRLPPDVTDNCTLLLEQVTPLLNLSSRFTFPNAARVTFPSLDLNVLWPLRAAEKRMRPDPPDFPFGRYVYGDRVINEILAKRLEGDAAWEFFQVRSAAIMPKIERLLEMEEARWRMSEATLDVQMSDAVFPNLRTKRMFWTYNHPNRELLCRFGGRILQAARLAPDDDQAATDFMWGLLTWEFGADYHQPLHPLVGEALKLEWWSPGMNFRRYDCEMDFETFVRRQIAWD